YLSAQSVQRLTDALTKTGSFLLLDVADATKRAVSNDLTGDHPGSWIDKIRPAAISEGMDVVVVGRYVVINDQVKMEAIAYDVNSGRLASSESATGVIGPQLVAMSDQLSSGLSSKMKDALPPLPEREVNKTEHRTETIVKKKEIVVTKVTQKKTE